MASLFKRERSPFWQIRFIEPTSGEWTNKSTKFRIGIGAETRRAEQLRAEYTLRESSIQSHKPIERWDAWVPGFLKLVYTRDTTSRNPSLERYLTAWRTLKMFLKNPSIDPRRIEEEITVPRQFRRDHCFKYMTWRQEPNKTEGKYKAGHNTALLELKTMGIIMDEAVIRGYASANPCHRLKIKRIAGKVKPELTPAIVDMIRQAIPKEEEPMRTFFNNSFEIAYYHGVRLSETWFNPQECVRFVAPDKAQVTFVMKGGKTNAVFVHPKLINLFRNLIDSGATETYPKPRSFPGNHWTKFLTRHGIKATLPNACFHSTRVTVATKLARAGVSEKKAMEYIKHASTTVHRSYVRLQPDDLTECSDAIS